MNAERKKLSHGSFLFPIVDIIIALVIVAGIALGIVAALVNRDSGTTERTLVTLVFSDLPASAKNDISSGKSLYFGGGAKLGDIASVSQKDTELLRFDSRVGHGEYVKIATGGTDFTVTLTVDTVKFGGVHTVDGNELIIGSKIAFHTDSRYLEATVVSLEEAKEQEKP